MRHLDQVTFARSRCVRGAPWIPSSERGTSAFSQPLQNQFGHGARACLQEAAGRAAERESGERREPPMPSPPPPTMSVVASHRRTLTKRGMAARTAAAKQGYFQSEITFESLNPPFSNSNRDRGRCGLVYSDLRALPPEKTRPATPEREGHGWHTRPDH